MTTLFNVFVTGFTTHHHHAHATGGLAAGGYDGEGPFVYGDVRGGAGIGWAYLVFAAEHVFMQVFMHVAIVFGLCYGEEEGGCG